MADHKLLTTLFDPATFHLHAHYPRRSTAKDPKPFSHRPWTAVYLLFYLPFLLVAVPPYAALRWTYAWLFVSHAPKWSLIDFTVVYTVRHTLLYWWTATDGGLRGIFHKGLTDAQRSRRRSWLNAMPDEIAAYPHEKLVEPMRSWAIETNVPELKGTVPIWWKGKRSNDLHQPQAKPGEKLLVYLTGGGYMISSCHPAIPLSHLNHSMMDVFQAYAVNHPSEAHKVPHSSVTVEYRKSGETPTPAALLDCLALYVYLINTLGFAAEDMVLLGDSAGGHLVNSVIRYLIDANLPVPGAAILISPWTDQAGTTIEHPCSSFKRNEPYDVLSDGFYHMCRDTFAMHFRDPNETLLDVYYSPCAILGKIKKDGRLLQEQEEASIFRGWPRTFLVGCHGDVLLDQTTEMHRRVALSKRAEGKAEQMDIHLGLCKIQASHDPFVAPPFVFGKERRRALKMIVEWLVAGTA